jgi:lipopolysaccharide transport system ATP-binding protein
MYVRLAFAVAAHLEPEILIVDEVLAVGDTEFQRKCLGKMQTVATQEGRTLFFVSHNLRAVQTLCNKAIFLQSGCVKHAGSVDECLRAYSDTGAENRKEFITDSTRPSISFASIEPSELEKGNLVVEVGFTSPFALSPPVAGLVISSPLGTPVFGTNPRIHNRGFGKPKLSQGILRLVANGLPIHSGSYRLSLWLGDWQTDYDEKRDVLSFDFKGGHPVNNAPSPEVIGFVDMSATWSIANHAAAS